MALQRESERDGQLDTTHACTQHLLDFDFVYEHILVPTSGICLFGLVWSCQSLVYSYALAYSCWVFWLS